ncbi:MAG: large conductance mechanosensitive channel protein MscL [Dehalogenimonas sp.]|uniref:Large-conductance mechanosensitive channel n=1 Tax=Candidatus Dehalogenimonas loeffleri TaxID=3127115 RepID=A0ABZ2JAY9_9CHLR|nr:large conductance mechanosensitive channel protein MscL [Dehalogenimonas sp.]
MLKEFKTFIMRGSVVDLAVGIVIGAAFGAIVNSLVKDVIMPPVGMLLGNVDFTNLYFVLEEGATAGPYASLTAAQEAGAVTVNYGVFFNAVISFLILAAAIFFFVVRPINRMAERRAARDVVVPPAPETKECPFCFTAIPVKARRCPNCTSDLT